MPRYLTTDYHDKGTLLCNNCRLIENISCLWPVSHRDELGFLQVSSTKLSMWTKWHIRTIVKETVNSVAPVLTLICSSTRKTTRQLIIPIFKKKARSSPTNYRSISLKYYSIAIVSIIILCDQQHEI